MVNQVAIQPGPECDKAPSPGNLAILGAPSPKPFSTVAAARPKRSANGALAPNEERPTTVPSNLRPDSKLARPAVHGDP